MAKNCKWGFGCGRRTPSDTDELEAWQAPGEDMNATCWTGWGCKDPHCDRLRIERLESALSTATARAEAAEAKARDVETLDEWARANPDDALAPRYLGDEAQPGAEWELFTGKEWERFETPTEARAAAAQWVRENSPPQKKPTDEGGRGGSAGGVVK